MKQPDLIVVGAGSAGCLLAASLARSRGLRVTLVEAPSRSASGIDRQRPSRWLNLLGSSEDWDLRTESCSALSGRKLSWPRGRGLGGSSRINAMIWFPPTDHDISVLVEASGRRWTPDAVRAAYQSVCERVQPQQPLWISDAARRFMSAAGDIPHAAPMVYDRVNRQGRRWNPASLLGCDRGAGSLEVIRATVDRLIWDDNRAVGVRLMDRTNASQLHASHGVVLCAGSIATPAILMRSGVGPRDDLARHEIDLRAEHAGVGENLQDHLIMPVIFQTKSKTPFSADSTVRDLARWQSLGTGPIGSNVAECGGLFNDDTLQIHVTPTNYLTYPRTVAPVMTVGVNVTQPMSRGSIRLDSRQPDDPPLVDAGYLGHPSDVDATIQGVRLARLIGSCTGLADWIVREELPGSKRESDASIGRTIARYAQTLYHPVGTCRLGCDSDSVVDAEFAVRGTERLWVADGSLLPKLTVGNPNATIMSLAWMAGDVVRDKIESNEHC